MDENKEDILPKNEENNSNNGKKQGFFGRLFSGNKNKSNTIEQEMNNSINNDYKSSNMYLGSGGKSNNVTNNKGFSGENLVTRNNDQLFVNIY